MIHFLPFFCMHFIGFVMIEPHANVERATAVALNPFDEQGKVAPYRVHFDPPELLRMASHYGIAPTDLSALAEKIQDWTHHRGGVDANGLYYVTNCNPDGRWDWYEIGGRWDGYLDGQNVVRAGGLARDKTLKTHLPYFVLNPDGEWIERAPFDFVGNSVTSQAMPERVWLTKVREQLQRWPDYLVVCVDAHC